MSHGLLALMATVTHLGLAVLTAGVLFYVTGRDIIVEPDAGTTLGPAMVVASMASVFFVLARGFGVEAREGGSTRPRILVSVIAALTVCYVAMLTTGSVLYALRRSEGVWLVLFAGRYALSPFVVVTSLCAGIVVTGAILLSRIPERR